MWKVNPFKYNRRLSEEVLIGNSKLGGVNPECINSNVQHSFVDSAPVLERRWAQKARLS